MDWVMPAINLRLILPEIIVCFFAILILILDPFLSKEKKIWSAHLAWIAVVITFIANLRLWNFQGTAFTDMYMVDNYATFFKFIFLVGSFLIILVSMSYLKREEILHGEYFSLILFSTLGMMLLASGFDLIIIFLGLEIMSVSLYVLAGFKRDALGSNEASLKYFLIGAFATGFLLYGIVMIYGSVGSTNLNQIISSILGGQTVPDLLIWSGAGLLLVGFGFKIAAVPFHMWVPDVYQGAPTPITAFISAGPKAAGFAALLRVFLFSFPTIKPDWTMIVWIMAALTMSLGNIIAIAQSDIKRMLAYSSIAHAGYVLVALVGGGAVGISSALFYLLAYTFMNIGAFTVVIALGRKGQENTNLEDFKGLSSRSPVLALLMTIFLLSLAGFPPTAGFMAKFYVFSSAVKTGFVGLVIIGVLNSLVSVYYYLRIVVFMFMQPPQAETEKIRLAFGVGMVLFISTWFVLQMGIFPQSLLNWAQASVSSIF
ncbi:MAG TPA: NADH-quinone oxidoreductase subunit N [candidate division Zixibacteria bacterium]